MKNPKVKIGIAMAVVAIAFYLLGSFIGWPGNSEKFQGDIGKAKKSTSTVVKIDKDAMQEKMLSDSVYCKQMLATVGAMQLHAKQFGALLLLTEKVANDEAALQKSLKQMDRVSETVKNADAAIDLFADDMVKLSKGEKVADFEQDWNNALLGFKMMQSCSNVAVNFAKNVQDSLAILSEANKKNIEFLSQEWAGFAYADAIMSHDELRIQDMQQLGVVIDVVANEDQLGSVFPVKFNQEELNIFFSQEKLNLIFNKEELAANQALLGMATSLNYVIIAQAYIDGGARNSDMLGDGAIYNNSEVLKNSKPNSETLNIDLPCIEALNSQVIVRDVENLNLVREIYQNTESLGLIPVEDVLKSKKI